jgi:hypothetical protein|tara:strand:- start:2212 stop:2385 length:174 start_codon:yes stop_codon:yes gene_type:complete
MPELGHTCSICSCIYTESEGGIEGNFGILPVAFCPTCYSSTVDMVKQLEEGYFLDSE